MYTNLGRWTHGLFRIAVGALFLQHGLQKLLGFFGGMDGAGAVAPLASLMGAAGILEGLGGMLLIVGLVTRPVAVVLLLEMLTAYGMVHLPLGGWPIRNQGELALLYASAFLFLAGSGPGALSLDEVLAGRTLGERRHGVADRRAA